MHAHVHIELPRPKLTRPWFINKWSEPRVKDKRWREEHTDNQTGEIEPLIIKVIYGPDKPCLPVLFYMYTGIKYNYTIYLVDDTMIWQVCKEMCR